MRDTFLPWAWALALTAAALSGGVLYAAAPRQQWLSRPIPAVAAAGIALPLLAAGIWLMSGVIGPAPGFFAMCAAWLLALVGAPWLAVLRARSRAADGA